MRTQLCTLALLIIMAGAASASGIPDLGLSYWTCRTDNDVVVVVCPEGDGMTLDAAWPVSGGDLVDATIDVWVLDGSGTPVFLYPFEDIWVEGPDLYQCIGGVSAEASTEITGHTTFRTLFAGGHALGNLQVMVSGEPISGSAPNLRLTSPDIVPDGVIAISDLASFAQFFMNGANDPRADLDANGEINLTDAVLLVRHQNHSCP